MILQDILWPEINICMEENMYFRTNEKVQRLADKFLFDKGGNIFSDTYFNSVSVDKWIKYTKINNLSVSLLIKGTFKINLIYKKNIHGKIFEDVVSEFFVCEKEKKEIKFLFPKGDGMACFSLCAIENNSEFYGGNYSTEVNEEELQNVKIGLGICTFRREKFIENNLNILNHFFLKNNNSELNGKLEVFISDNGRTLDIEKLATDHIHIVKNKNTGGSGGFTRTLIEMLDANKRDGLITHALLMDDDITISPKSLLKTYRILRLLKKEYLDAFIGGAMLRSDTRNIQVESGASWNIGKILSLKSGLNMESCSACLYNEIEEYREYNAWWYCCFPINIVREDNLPLPLFIRGDDQEYGLRNMKHLILMNGICVWHEPFDKKYSSFLFYYIFRNQLINNALYCPDCRVSDIRKQLFDSIAHELAYYRYKNIDLIIRGTTDFMRGVDFFLSTDGEKLHQEIMNSGYRAKPLEKLDVHFSYPTYEHSLNEKDKGIKRIIRIVTLNGYLLPTKRNSVVSMSNIRPINAYRAKKILHYDISSSSGFITQRSEKKFIVSVFKLVKTYILITFKYQKAKENYQIYGRKLQNISFWEKYLEMKNEHV